MVNIKHVSYDIVPFAAKLQLEPITNYSDKQGKCIMYIAFCK